MVKFDKMRREWRGYDMEVKTKSGHRAVIVNPGVRQAAFVDNWVEWRDLPWSRLRKYRVFHYLLDVRTESYRHGPYWSAHVWVPIEVLTVVSLLVWGFSCGA